MTQVSINTQLLILSLGAMPSRMSIDKFQQLCSITSRTTADELLNYLSNSAIGKLSGDCVSFSQSDKLNTILLAMAQGCNPEQISKKLRWNDFELFTSMLIQSAGYTFEKNIVFNNPRMQIDVIGYHYKIALIIDCKHWMKIHGSNISKFSTKQIMRAKVFLDKRRDIEAAIPIIVTLHDHKYNFYDNIPIVPISRFGEFLQNFPFNLDRLHCIRRK